MGWKPMRQIGGEDRNRTYLGSREPTTVLKTARATRHPSLSGIYWRNGVMECWRDGQTAQLFLIALTTASKSGQSPESSLEWMSLPLARISKALPLEGMSVSDLMRPSSSTIW